MGKKKTGPGMHYFSREPRGGGPAVMPPPLFSLAETKIVPIVCVVFLQPRA